MCRYIINKNCLEQGLKKDWDRRFKKFSGKSRVWKIRYYLSRPQYKTLFYYRLYLASARFIKPFFHWLYSRNSLKSGVEFNLQKLGGGIIIPHWGRIILNAHSIGENFYVFHNVTVGNNYTSGKPVIGNNVLVGTGSTILGDITIGYYVIIVANSLVNSVTPSNVIIAGSPAKVIKNIEPDAINKLIGY